MALNEGTDARMTGLPDGVRVRLGTRIEVQLREYAEGCEKNPVGLLSSCASERAGTEIS
jgi:hypothetical protein